VRERERERVSNIDPTTTSHHHHHHIITGTTITKNEKE